MNIAKLISQEIENECSKNEISEEKLKKMLQDIDFKKRRRLIQRNIKIGSLIAGSFLAVALLFLYINSKSGDENFIPKTDLTKVQSYANRDIPSNIIWGDKVYQAKDIYTNTGIGDRVGKITDGEIFTVNNNDISEVIALKVDDRNYLLFEAVNYTEKNAINDLFLNISFQEKQLDKLGFPDYFGDKKIYINTKAVTLKTSFEKVGSYAYLIRLTEKWDIQEHNWIFKVSPGIIEFIEENGNPAIFPVKKSSSEGGSYMPKTNSSKVQSYANRDIPSNIIWGDKVYQAKDIYTNTGIGDRVGKITDGEIFTVNDNDISEVIALKVDDRNYLLFEAVNYTEKNAINDLFLNISFQEKQLDKLGFPDYFGDKKIYINTKTVTLKTSFEKVGSYAYLIRLTERWDIQEHNWIFKVSPGIIEFIEENGNPAIFPVKKSK